MSHKVKLAVVQYFYRVVSMVFGARFWLREISIEMVKYDFWAGLTGVVMVLPQGVAFAVIAGLPPAFGLYSAIFVQLIAGFFGSSRHMVTGPTVALSIVIPSIIAHMAPMGSSLYISLSLTLMAMVGFIQLCFGIFRFGSLVNFISHTVIIGFTAGASVLIIVSQMSSALGLDIKRGLKFVDKVQTIYALLPETHAMSLLIALTTIISALIFKRLNRRFPYMLLGMVISTLLCLMLGDSALEVKRLGELPAALPAMQIPRLNFPLFVSLFPAAFALALLGLIEAVSIARSIGTRSHQHIDCNQEFFGQGLANLLGSCFSCYVGSGSFNRSAINYDAGARTPLSLFFTSLMVAAVLFFVPWITRYLPMPAMAGAIILAGYNLFDFKHIKIIARTSRNELAIVIVTFLSTLFFDLEFAIYAGVILSLVLYLQKTSHPLLKQVDFSQVEPVFEQGHMPVRITVLRLHGSLFFGSVNHVQTRLSELNDKNDWQHVIILAEGMNIVDLSGIEALLVEKQRLQEKNGDLYIIGVKSHVRRKLRRTPYWRQLGGQYHVFETTHIALRAICKNLGIRNYREFMKHLFRDYNRL